MNELIRKQKCSKVDWIKSENKQNSKMSYSGLYTQKQLIGRGHYGRVYLIIDKRSQQPFVAKKIQFQGMSQQQKQKALKQTQIHQKLTHKNILQFKEYYLQNETLIMIMQYCEFGDLSVYIKQRKQKGELFEQALIVNWFVQMLFGLNYLHERKVLHRDIKSQNIFIDSQGAIKLADFGISKMLQHTQNLASTVVGTPYYLSPQACSSTGYNFKSDIWSLGCVLFELCTLEYPFNGDNILLLAKKISSEQPKDISKKYSQQIQKLLKLMLKKKPEQRPSVKQILQSKFISEYIIKFKMQDSIEEDIVYEQEQLQGQTQKYPIFQTTSVLLDNDNEFMDLEYQNGQVQKIPQNQFIDLQYTNGKVQKINNTSNAYNNSNKSSPSQKYNQSPKVNKMDQIKISPQKSRAQSLRLKCVQKMGSELFEEMYGFMRQAQKKNLQERQVQQQLRSRYSKKEFQLSMDVAQLLYLEEMGM